MQLIETVTLASAAASIEFTGIPQDGTDLLLLVGIRNADDAFSYNMDFNGVTALANYSARWLRGSGSSVSSFGFPESSVAAMGNSNTATASTFSNDSIYISNYTSEVAKSYSIDGVTENNATLAYQLLSANRTTITDAISSIRLFPTGTNFATGSTASLYKITKA